MIATTEIPPIAFVIIAAVAAAIGWIAGEAMNRPALRRICGPLIAARYTMISNECP